MLCPNRIDARPLSDRFPWIGKRRRSKRGLLRNALAQLSTRDQDAEAHFVAVPACGQQGAAVEFPLVFIGKNVEKSKVSR